MKIGICGVEDRFAGAAENGFSYMDVTMTKVRDLTDDALCAMRERAGEMGLTIDAFVGFFAPDVPLYGDDATAEKAVEYATRNFEVARILGGDICCVGSGKARAIPAGWEAARAEDAFVAVMQKLADRADSFGVRLAVEPLRYAETDLINTISDGIRVKRAIDRKNVGCLVDFFHAYSNGDDLSALDALRPGELIHAHLARPNPDRGAPLEEDLPTLIAWRDKLRAIGYDQRLTLECKWIPDFASSVAEAARTMRIFK